MQSSAPKVQTKALTALGGILANAQKPSDRDGFATLAPIASNVVSSLIQRRCDAEVCDALEILIDICELQPRFFKGNLNNVVLQMTAIASSKALDDGARQLALEFLTTMAESASSMVRKLNNADGTFTRETIPVVMAFILEFDDMTMTEWLKPAASGNAWMGEEEVDYTNSDVGLEALDRIANAIGHKRVLPTTFAIIGEFMADGENWRRRYAGLMAIAHIAEAMPSKEPNLGEVTKKVAASAVHDPVPRVRYAAINTIGQL